MRMLYTRISKHFALPLILALGLLSAPFAMADGQGLYLGGGIYYGVVSENVDITGDGKVKIKDNSTSFNLELGWRFNKWFSIDGGYTNLGSYKDSDDTLGKAEVSADAWKLGAMGSLPIWIIDLYARGGAAWWNDETKDALGKETDNGRGWYYGLGLAFNLGESLDIFLEWQRYDFDFNTDTVGAGVRFTF